MLAQELPLHNPEYGMPLLVLTEINPELRITGSDVPTFALYEQGQIIYKEGRKRESSYAETRLAREQLQELLGSFLISDDLLQLPRDTAASRAKGQPTMELLFNFDTLRVIRVYGDLRKDKIARENTPPAFLKVFDKITAYRDKQARKWLPEKIEVLVTDYKGSARQAIEWPASWPSLKSPDTIWRSEKLYSLYLDKKHYKELLSLMAKLKGRRAVEINGKKFSIDYRLPFPNL